MKERRKERAEIQLNVMDEEQSEGDEKQNVMVCGLCVS